MKGLAIPLVTLPNPRYWLRCAVRDYNLKSDNARGSGNRWRRRAGLPVVDPHLAKNPLCMDRRQIARMFRGLDPGEPQYPSA